MPDPIGKTEFWKTRITEAKDFGEMRMSVYKTSPQDWEYLCGIHKQICKYLIKQDDKVLDVGCGYGRLSDWFQNYCGVDFSPEFIQEARKNYPDREFVVSDIKDMPYIDKEFDWAVCVSIKGMVIREAGDVEWLMMEKEIKRVAKNILILEYSSPANYEVFYEDMYSDNIGSGK